MAVEKIISIISILIWLIPPIKQFRTRYFIFFLIIAAADPLLLFCLFVFRMSPQIIAAFLPLSLIAALLPQIKLWKRLSVFVPFAFIIVILRNSNQALLLINSLFHIVLLMIIISKIIDYLNTEHRLNLFLLMLSLYVLVSILKILFVVTDLLQGVAQFYFATVFQIMFGILFSLLLFTDKRFDIGLTRNN